MRIFYLESSVFNSVPISKVIRHRILDYLNEHEGDILAVSGLKDEQISCLNKFQNKLTSKDLTFFLHSGKYLVNEKEYILTGHDLQINQIKIQPFQGCMKIIQIQSDGEMRVDTLVFDFLVDPKFSHFFKPESLLSEQEILDTLIKATEKVLSRFS